MTSFARKNTNAHPLGMMPSMGSHGMSFAQPYGNAAMQDLLPPKWTVADVVSLAQQLDAAAFARAEAELGYQPEIVKEGGMFRGYWNPPESEGEQGYIQLDPGLSKEVAAQVLVVELGNAARTSTYGQLQSEAEQGMHSKKGYAKEVERVEFGARMEGIHAFENGVEAGLLDQDDAAFDTSVRDFETYYADPRAKRHSKMYEREWAKHYKQAWREAQREERRAGR